MDERRRQLLACIQTAFAGVALGDGVSMHETEVIDSYGSEEERREAREPDEKTDWRRVVDHPDLTVYFDIGRAGMCFLDAAGMRFYLPACLYRAVRDFGDDSIEGMYQSLCNQVTDLDDEEYRWVHQRFLNSEQLASIRKFSWDKMSLLSNEQRACVRDCLVYFYEESEQVEEELA